MNAKPDDTLRIENIVASAKVADRIDLQTFCEKYRDVDYEKKRFPGIVFQMQDPRLTALLFGSGKVILTGAKITQTLSDGLAVLRKKLRKFDPSIPKKLTRSIQNIVISSDIGMPVNLKKAAVAFSLDNIEYKPGQFPGLVYRRADPKVVILFCGLGKLIITSGRVPGGYMPSNGKPFVRPCKDPGKIKRGDDVSRQGQLRRIFTERRVFYGQPRDF